MQEGEKGEAALDLGRCCPVCPQRRIAGRLESTAPLCPAHTAPQPPTAPADARLLCIASPTLRRRGKRREARHQQPHSAAPSVPCIPASLRPSCWRHPSRAARDGGEERPSKGAAPPRPQTAGHAAEGWEPASWARWGAAASSGERRRAWEASTAGKGSERGKGRGAAAEGASTGDEAWAETGPPSPSPSRLPRPGLPPLSPRPSAVHPRPASPRPRPGPARGCLGLSGEAGGAAEKDSGAGWGRQRPRLCVCPPRPRHGPPLPGSARPLLPSLQLLSSLLPSPSSAEGAHPQA